jgi:prephenate dehydratase/chorismate mutase
MENEITDPRAAIDSIDSELLRLLNRRASIALNVGRAKAGADASLCDPRRERQVLERVRRDNPGPLDEKAVESIFQRIIDESLHLQQRAYQRPAAGAQEGGPQQIVAGDSRVAILGEPGTFSEEAAMAVMGKGAATVSCPNFDQLFRAIDQGRADYILSPLENMLAGSVHRCYDLLLGSDLHIAAEIVLPVSLHLIGPAEARIETLETVESHPAALAQCERFFAAYPHLKRAAADDTAGAVRRAVESGDARRAAIGSRRAAEMYGGRIIREDIEDHPGNFTRFVLLSPQPVSTDRADKVSLVITLGHTPGSLHAALRPFVRRGIDLLKIESRPVRDDPGRFYFYLDVRPPATEKDLTGALEEISEQGAGVRYLGSYRTLRL